MLALWLESQQLLASGSARSTGPLLAPSSAGAITCLLDVCSWPGSLSIAEISSTAPGIRIQTAVIFISTIATPFSCENHFPYCPTPTPALAFAQKDTFSPPSSSS